jgi:hypothetical protein
MVDTSKIKQYSKEMIGKNYLEDVAVASVTTVFEEFATITVASALLNKGVVKTNTANFAVSEVMRLFFAWLYYVVFSYYGRKDLALLTSGIVAVLFIYDMVEHFLGKSPQNMAYQAALSLTSKLSGARTASATSYMAPQLARAQVNEPAPMINKPVYNRAPEMIL